MQDHLVQKIKSDPNYHKLVKVRSGYGWWLTLAMLVVYYGYILLIAFNKEFMASKLGAGVMTWGMPLGLFVILFTVVITGIYVRRANSEFDELTEAIKAKVKA
ncbi:DUF485 domain-containing protein [Pseudoduganella danionis]|uniref:DUF485 domain-containing protein n=1 Tax=Pseudoduganella danionis TaxID=1890295 RepID=A0ABW9SNI6_9BURK|nr:DUF485 domain-containing protein [Pseudoduganella danionis]MTW33435.1 DUF485 domain-containing protein [Pseudoduganella danionis]